MAVLKWPTFWAPRPQKPTRKSIREWAAPGEYVAGRTCYQQGGIVSAFIRRNLAWVTVRDDNVTFTVVAPLDNYTTPYCPCGRRTHARSCIHGVAALLCVADTFGDLTQDDIWKNIGKTVASIPADALRKFAADVPAGTEPGARSSDGEKGRPNPGAPPTKTTDAEIRAYVVDAVLDSGEYRDLFADVFGEPDLPDHRECRTEMAYMFNAANPDHMYPAPRVGLADFFKAAKAHEARCDINEAILTYRAITEAIMADGVDIEDEDRYYSSSVSRALNRMAICIKRHLRDPDQRRPHIEYLHRRLVDEYYDWFFKKYKDAIFKICTSREDLAYLRDLHHSYMAAWSTKFKTDATKRDPVPPQPPPDVLSTRVDPTYIWFHDWQVSHQEKMQKTQNTIRYKLEKMNAPAERKRRAAGTSLHVTPDRVFWKEARRET